MVEIGKLLKLDKDGNYRISGSGPSMEKHLAKKKTRKRPVRAAAQQQSVAGEELSRTLPVMRDSSIRIVSPTNKLCGILTSEQKYKLNLVFESVSTTHAVLLKEPEGPERLRILKLSYDNPTLSEEELAEISATIDLVSKQNQVYIATNDKLEKTDELKVRYHGFDIFTTSNAASKRRLTDALSTIHPTRVNLRSPSVYDLPHGPRGLDLSKDEQVRVFCENLAKGTTRALALARARTFDRSVYIRGDSDVYDRTRLDAEKLSQNYVVKQEAYSLKKAREGISPKARHTKTRGVKARRTRINKETPSLKVPRFEQKAPRSPYGDRSPVSSIGGMKARGATGQNRLSYSSTPLPEPMSQEQRRQVWLPNSDARTLKQIDSGYGSNVINDYTTMPEKQGIGYRQKVKRKNESRASKKRSDDGK